MFKEAEREMNPEVIATEIIPRLSKNGSKGGPSIYLSAPSFLSQFQYLGGNLESLIENFLDYVLKISHTSRCVRVGIHEKKKMCDLEKFFSIYPDYWLDLNIESQAKSGFEEGAKRILKHFGYRCPEWVGVEGTEAQLGAFHFGAQEMPALILFIQNHGARRSCDFLIPVLESVPYFAHAI